MSDVFDEIIDRLPPSTLKLILNFNNDRLNLSTNVNNFLQDIQEIKISQVNRELKRKIFDINSKATENKKCLIKLKSELDALKSLKNSAINEQGIKAYILKINELESKTKTLTECEDDVDLTKLFNEIEDLNLQIDDYKTKISEAKSKYQSYNDFPPDIEQGKAVIAKIKERIKHHESVFESFFQH